MMKKIIAAALLTTAGIAQVNAGPFNGFGAGLNAGVLMDKNKAPKINGLKIKDANKTMAQFGIQFDYIMSKANSIYSHVALVFSMPTSKSTSTTNLPTGEKVKATAKNNVKSELQAALGYNFCDDVAVYALAGVSVSKKSWHGDIKGSKTQASPVVGAGIKKKITNNLSAGLEYKHEFQPGTRIDNLPNKPKIKSQTNEVLARITYHF
jgi:opacity protein-like surface antigen